MMRTYRKVESSYGTEVEVGATAFGSPYLFLRRRGERAGIDALLFEEDALVVATELAKAAGMDVTFTKHDQIVKGNRVIVGRPSNDFRIGWVFLFIGASAIAAAAAILALVFSRHHDVERRLLRTSRRSTQS